MMYLRKVYIMQLVKEEYLEEQDDILEEDFDDYKDEGFAGNMFCDNYGYCCGTSCRNYFKCMVDSK